MGHHPPNLCSHTLLDRDEHPASHFRHDWPFFAPVLLLGDVADPGFYNLPSLASVTTQTATYTTHGIPITDTYTGVKLWDLLGEAGGVTVTSAGHDILSKYVVATGADGDKAVFALGEIHPDFAAQPIMVAYDDTNGRFGPHGWDGRARMVVPGDHTNGRNISDLVKLQVLSLPEPRPTGPGGPAEQLLLSGDVADPTIVTPETLAALNNSVTMTATYVSSHEGTITDTYTGVSLWTLIEDAGLLTDPHVKNDLLNFIVVGTGSDGYRAIISVGEIAPQFGNQPVLVAYADTIGHLGPGGRASAMQLVVPGDTQVGRYVENLVSLEVIDTSEAGKSYHLF